MLELGAVEAFQQAVCAPVVVEIDPEPPVVVHARNLVTMPRR